MKKMISMLICLAMVMAMTMAVPFAALAADGNSGSIQVEAEYRGAGIYENYVKNYTFTAEKEGEYTFSVPAGLGVWDMVGFLLGDESMHYVNYATNTAGATFTLTLKAGENFKFYVGTNSADVTSGTITWTLPDPNGGSIQVAVSYVGDAPYANYTGSYSFTAQNDGEYTFFVPAGLGVWERTGYWLQDTSTHYVDYTTNTAGGTFTLTLTAGQSFMFYVGTNSPDLTSGTITWTFGGGNVPEQPSADQVAADAVIAQIEAIGTVTLDSKTAIEAVRAAYDKLTDVQKDLVTNYTVLTKAEADLKALEDQAAAAPNSGSIPVVAEYKGAGQHENYKKNHTFTAPKDGEYTFFVPAGLGVWEFWGYWDYIDGISPNNKLYVDYATNTEGKTFTLTLTAGQNFKFYVGTNSPDLTSGTITWTIGGNEPEQPNADQVAADAVIAQIEAIGTVTLDSKTAIEAARAAYDKLTDVQKRLVTNYNTLTKAEADLKALEDQAAQDAADKAAADAVIAQIEAIGTVTKDSEAAITAARAAYDKLTDAQKRLVTNYNTLTKAEADFEALPSDPVNPPVDPDQPIIPAGDDTFVFFALVVLSMTALVVLVSKKRTF